MGFAMGFACGLAWGLGALFTSIAAAYTGPLSLLVVAWPVLLVLEAFGLLRERRQRRSQAKGGAK